MCLHDMYIHDIYIPLCTHCIYIPLYVHYICIHCVVWRGSGGAVFNESKLYLTDLIELISAALFNNVTGVRGAAAAFLEQLVYAALIYLCMRPYATCV
jgi:hypothetical protein